MALSVAVAVGDEIADTVIAKLQNEISKLKFGHFADKNNDFGPVITAEHKAKVIGFIDSAEQQGAKIVVDGRQASVDDFKMVFLWGPL
jgi:malonate-semialdehyde dehydrogenase (acetylating)/methylmalonate-semialdehyde dehydrogenase